MNKTKKIGRGAPSRYRIEYNDIATRAAMLGETNESMAKLFGVHIATFMRWMQRHIDFRDAVKKGRQEADQNVAISLYKRAIGYSHPEDKIFLGPGGEPVIVPTTKYYPPDPASGIFWLKNRRPDLWREKPESKSDDDTPVPIKYSIVVEDARRDEDKGK